jgi:RNA-directed DNA polymerase
MKVGNWLSRDPLEGRGGHQDVPIEGYMATRRGRATMSTELSRLSELAKADKTTRLLSIAHLLTPAALMAAFEGLRKDASAGVDEVTYREYEQDVWRNIPTLHHRLVSRQYRAQPLRRVYIPKENGKERPISIPALEDKIVQKATGTVLNAIYEQDFRPCSYGFRPGLSPHDALDAIGRTICRGPISYVLEADIQGYFDAIVREQLMAFVERRIGDGSILRLIRKWIHVGVIEDGRLLVTETGTGQGQVISPLLANIYLHYVLDEWFEHEVKPRLRGQAAEIRYADDFILCFQYREDAERVREVLSKRFAKYGLTLHPEKTRLLAFGRSALPSGPGAPQPATFDFLGFTHVCARSRWGRFTIHVRTLRKRLRRSVKAVAQWCQQHRHDPVEDQAAALNAKLRGHYQYYGRPTNFRNLQRFHRLVSRLWHKWLNRRTRGKRLTWDTFHELLHRHPLLLPRICHARAG